MSAIIQSCHEPKAELRAPTVLVAEDEILIRAMVAQHLRSAGFRIIEASNAHEAIDILTSGESVDVLFTDVRMVGEKDGIRLAQWVERNRPAIRIVFGSGETNLVDAVPGARLFSKPYDLEDVERYVRGLVAGPA
ncbi:MAG TPA: response regulator [Rhizomicrobium sp.]|jgi:CheY-like chemotaxis protein|nr:response regulator [Rhizomicrobium sp.]